MKKFFALIIALALLTIALPHITSAHAAQVYNVDVFVDGNQVNFPDQKPFIDDSVDRTYVPVRFVSEALGCNVGWDGATRTVNIAKSGTWVDIQIGSMNPRITDVDTGKETSVVIDAPAMLVNDRTMVPLRFVSEVLKAEVKWTAPEQTGNGRGRVDVNQKQDINLGGSDKAAGKIEKIPDGGGGVNTTPANNTKWPVTK